MLTLRDLVLGFVLLDWDGTIIDTTEPGIDLIEILARERGLHFTEETREILNRTWGAPGYLLLSGAFGFSEEEGHAFYDDWCALEARVQLEEGKCLLYPGAEATLQNFRVLEKLLGLNTSRPEKAIGAVTHRLNVQQYFDHIAFKGSCAYHKPDPRSFSPLLDHFGAKGLSKENCIWVGDTPADVEAGLAAEITTFAVRTGRFRYENPEKLHPDFVIDSLGDLIPRMRDLGWRE